MRVRGRKRPRGLCAVNRRNLGTLRQIESNRPRKEREQKTSTRKTHAAVADPRNDRHCRHAHDCQDRTASISTAIPLEARSQAQLFLMRKKLVRVIPDASARNTALNAPHEPGKHVAMAWGDVRSAAIGARRRPSTRYIDDCRALYEIFPLSSNRLQVRSD